MCMDITLGQGELSFGGLVLIFKVTGKRKMLEKK